MTILSAFQSAAIKLLGKKPSALFSGQDKFALEMQDLVNEVATDIAKSNDWQALVNVYTITGDGVTSEFPLPDDYDRMLLDSRLYDGNNWAWGYQRAVRADDFLQRDIYNWQVTNPGTWIIQGGSFRFLPIPPADRNAKFVYISKNLVKNENDEPKQAFTTDSDRFVLDERLLMLGLVWKWREMKRLDSTYEQANFEKAFNELSGRDKGARILVVGGSRPLADIDTAYPYSLGP